MGQSLSSTRQILYYKMIAELRKVYSFAFKFSFKAVKFCHPLDSNQTETFLTGRLKGYGKISSADK